MHTMDIDFWQDNGMDYEKACELLYDFPTEQDFIDEYLQEDSRNVFGVWKWTDNSDELAATYQDAVEVVEREDRRLAREQALQDRANAQQDGAVAPTATRGTKAITKYGKTQAH